MTSIIPTILTFLAALSVAGVAEWFSVVGIMSIYAGAPFHAGLIMGIVLGFAKLVTISWLYRNWKESEWKLRLPMIYFTIALMIATSIGVFGFLTKAHLEQGASTINNSAKIERLNQQIERERSTIADNEKVVAQLDAAINAYMGQDKTDKALAVRKLQAPQRKQLRAEIDAAQKNINSFDEEKLTLTSEVRALELEVGPIRYIAELFYGTDGNESEKVESAVKLFTLLIVSTLDPLAVVLLIAANHTLLRTQNGKKEKSLQEKELRNGVGINNASDKEISETQDNTGNQNAENRLGNNVVPIQESAAISDTEMDEKLRELVAIEDRVVNQPTIGIYEKILAHEKDVTKEEKDNAPLQVTAPPIILSPPVSRIGASGSAQSLTTTNSTMEDTIQVQDKLPVVNHRDESTVLREMIGQHFIPKQIIEKTPGIKEPTVVLSNDDPTIVTVESTNIRDKSVLPDATNKYPTSLSWLKEFKRD
jgi:hypothetical protein